MEQKPRRLLQPVPGLLPKPDNAVNPLSIRGAKLLTMRINAITNWAYGVTVLLTALSGAAFILSTNSAIKERQAVEQHLVLDTLGEELALGAETRTDEARLYVMRGDARHLEAFHRAEDEERKREEAVKTAANFGAAPSEIAVLKDIVERPRHSTRSRSPPSRPIRRATVRPRGKGYSGRSTSACRLHFWTRLRGFAT